VRCVGADPVAEARGGLWPRTRGPGPGSEMLPLVVGTTVGGCVRGRCSGDAQGCVQGVCSRDMFGGCVQGLVGGEGGMGGWMEGWMVKGWATTRRRPECCEGDGCSEGEVRQGEVRQRGGRQG
jgi:hypothetical protein